eukprot:TRINITY_DN7651_c0_g1_i2.p1 TRINITY_DN7651_c0_g1~~TRINITY_DN7651_c0_g1_i2.p1  ORF type:complete len:262 (-),score=40.79 TRINITY_DN7651_c0_g1_i2:41-826(-)
MRRTAPSSTRKAKKPKRFNPPPAWEALPTSLHDLLEDYLTQDRSYWTNAEVKRLAGSLMDSPPDKWKGAATIARVKLIRGRAVETPIEDTVQAIWKSLMEFETMCAPNSDCIKSRSIAADELYPLIQRANKRMTKGVVDDLVGILKDVASIDHKISSPEAFSAYIDFKPKWNDYLLQHPQLFRQLDPFYVVAALAGNPVPNWPVWPPGRPNDLPPGLDGQNYAWCFPTFHAATFWVGVAASVLPGVRMWIFDTGSNPALFY